MWTFIKGTLSNKHMDRLELNIHVFDLSFCLLLISTCLFLSLEQCVNNKHATLTCQVYGKLHHWVAAYTLF